MAKKTKTENVKTQKQEKGPSPVMLNLILALLVLAGLSWFFYSLGSKSSAKYFIEKPVDAISLPGAQMKDPEGYSIFKSDDRGILTYSFVRYEASWKNNNFVKIDLAIIPLKALGAAEGQMTVDNHGLYKKIVEQKSELYRIRSEALAKNGEKGRSYDIDYSRFTPGTITAGMINKREWKRIDLQMYEPQTDGAKIERTWSNRYTLYNGYIFIFDYVCDTGIVAGQTRTSLDYSASTGGIEKDIFKMIESLEFK
jgi:hypothetical protein